MARLDTYGKNNKNDKPLSTNSLKFSELFASSNKKVTAFNFSESS